LSKTAIAVGARRSLVTLAAVGSALALAACGSSGSSGSGSASSREATGIKVADCMRAHGVPNFPDPSSGGGIQLPNGVDPQAPAFQSAQRACFKLFPGGGPGGGGNSEARKVQLLKLAECMHAHHISQFPDPTSSPPTGPPSGGGIAFGSPGAFIAVPQSLIDSPGFKQAAAACGFPGVGRDAKGP
jgi:hypothetical protein